MRNILNWIGPEVPYLSLISVQMYLVNTTKPDIAFSVNLLARYSSAPIRRHRNEIKHMILFYYKACSLNFVGYADGGYLSDPYKARSQISYVFTCGDTAISWRYTKQSIITTSSNHAKIIAIHEASQECVWLRSTMHLIHEKFVDILHEAPLSVFAILAVGARWIFHPIERLVFPLLCSCNVSLLVVTGIFQQYLVYQVKKIRLQGYYIFSQKLKHIIRLPFATIAYGTAAMLLVMVWDPHISILSMPTLLRIIMLTEVVCVSSFMTLYIGCVHQYNSLDSQPDVLKSLYSPLQPSSSLEGLRYQDGGRLSDQQMILRLQQTLSKYERSNDGSAPQVDLAHLLATRDQELRTVKAEMNQLQSELWLARSITEEKDAEIQRIRNANNQYVEENENERLGAILGEWSNRAAKVILHYSSYIAMMFIVHLSSITPNVLFGWIKARTCIGAGTDVKLGTAEKNDHAEDSNA
ncbi:hypothetical protein CQW23_09430 [Capsicum baccatum]|uniref:Uncharacterized protein n=1 Tax=Capsicum baccatum TaxID=33114 RepID=A0A2G2WWS0_CAPBA|nr:hypothetical protein CQW23_09430 [Capsicum baccatum]